MGFKIPTGTRGCSSLSLGQGDRSLETGARAGGPASSKFEPIALFKIDHRIRSNWAACHPARTNRTAPVDYN
jgi:hypothetical protein